MTMFFLLTALATLAEPATLPTPTRMAENAPKPSPVSKMLIPGEDHQGVSTQDYQSPRLDRSGYKATFLSKDSSKPDIVFQCSKDTMVIKVEIDHSKATGAQWEVWCQTVDPPGNEGTESCPPPPPPPKHPK